MPMTKTYRELTGKEKRQIKKLVTSLCANYDKKYGCLPLDCECYMFGICHTNSALCKWFRNALLPTEPELQAVFESRPLTECKQCGKKFVKVGKRIYCSSHCAEEARRAQTASRVRKFRKRRK